MERMWALGCRRSSTGWYNGSISSSCLWALQVLVSWWLKGQTKTTADASRLLGSWLRLFLDRRDVPHYRGGGHILHYRIVPTRESRGPMFSWAWRWPHHRWVYCSILFFGHGKGWESDPDKIHLGTGPEGDTTGTRQDSRASITPPSLASIDVLCNGVHEIHNLRLEYYVVE